MQQSLKKHTFLYSILNNFILFILLFLVFDPQFGTTDDSEMQMILSGNHVFNEPYPILRYTSIFVGIILSKLYEIHEHFPWYGMYLIFAHFFGCSLILYSYLKINPTRFKLTYFYCIFLCFEAFLLQELQFTSSALMLSFGGIFLLFHCIINTPLRKYFKISIAIISILWASMIRYETFYLTLVLGFPIISYAIFQAEKKSHYILIVTFSILLIFVMNEISIQLKKKHEGWEKFYTYQHSIMKDSPLDYKLPKYEWNEKSAKIYTKNGWTFEDLQLYKQWFIADDSIFSSERFESIYLDFKALDIQRKAYQIRIWNYLIEFPIQDYVFICYLLFLTAFFFVKRDIKLILILSSTLIICICIQFYLSVFMHLPERVSHPISLFLLLVSGIFIGNDGIYKRSSKIIFLSLILFSGFSNLKNMIRKNHQFEQGKNTSQQILDSVPLNSDYLYMGAVDDLMHPLMHPFQCFVDSQLQKINVYDFGHLSNTPICDAQLNRFSIDNIHLSAIDNDSIFLIHRNESEFLIWYANFVHRHYDRIIQYEKVFSNQEMDLAIYKIKSKHARLDQMIYQADELKFLNKENEKEIFYY